MNSWQQIFFEIVENLVPRANPEIHRFWVLFVAGKSYGDGTWFWLHSFRQLYILHLLVLSGSQVEHLSRLVRAIFGHLSHSWDSGGFAAHRAGLLKMTLILVLLGFATGTGWTAPITRATLIALLSLLFLNTPMSLILILGFALQWIVFAEHRNEIGFYLSWIAYLVVLAMESFRISRFYSTLLVSGLLFVIVDTAYFGNPFQIGTFLTCLAANLLFCTVFDMVFLPLAAVVTLFVLFCTLVTWVYGEHLAHLVDAGGNFLALWMVPITKALLVVLKWLMYT